MELLWIIVKCIIIGVIWAALILPIIFKKGGIARYLITVFIITILCFLFRGYSSMINTMTLIALIALVIAFIASMAVFERESKAKSMAVSFAAVISGFSYLVYTLFFSGVHIL